MSRLQEARSSQSPRTITPKDIVTIKPYGRRGTPCVALNFSLFGKDKEAARAAYYEYVSSLDVESNALVEKTELNFFKITRCPASGVYERAQYLRSQLWRVPKPSS